MKRAGLILLLCAGCSAHVEKHAERHSPAKKTRQVATTRKTEVRVNVVRSEREIPQANLPMRSRYKNYNGGSCVCASTIAALHWIGRDDDAKRLREICSGGQSGQSIASKLDRLGIRYVATFNGDESVLRWACSTRRAVTLFFKPNHCCTLVGIDGDRFFVLDNNHIGAIEEYDRQRFMRLWHGVALVPLGSPPAPPL